MGFLREKAFSSSITEYVDMERRIREESTESQAMMQHAGNPRGIRRGSNVEDAVLNK